MPSSSSNIPILVSAFLASLTTGGTTYAFGIYSATLKDSLHLTQAELDTISSSLFCAGLLSFLPGFVVDRLGGKLGIIAGGLSGFLAHIVYWTVARQIVPISRTILVPALSFLGVIIFLSCALITGAVFKLIVSHCTPGSKGKAVGAAKGYVGLGAGLYAVLFESLGRDSDLDFLLLAAANFVIAAIIPAMILLPSKESLDNTITVDVSTPRHYLSLYMGLSAMAVLVVGDSLLQLFVESDGGKQKHKQEPEYFMTLTLMSVWFGPILGLLVLPAADASDTNTDQDVSEKDMNDLLIESSDLAQTEDVDLFEGTVEDQAKLTKDDDEILEEGNLVEQPQGHYGGILSRNLGQMLRTVPCWLLMVSCTLLVGSGTVMTNNLGQMVSSLQFSPSVTPPSLALFSVAQSFGRVMTGTVSEMAVARGHPRSIFLTIASTVALLAHGLLGVSATEVPFIVGVALSGLAFGMSWPLMVLMIGELFGTDHHGQNYMLFDGVTSAVGTLVISKGIAQAVYDNHGDGTNCSGVACFQQTHFTVTVLVCVSAVLSLFVPCTKLSKQAYGKPSSD